MYKKLSSLYFTVLLMNHFGLATDNPERNFNMVLARGSSDSNSAIINHRAGFFPSDQVDDLEEGSFDKIKMLAEEGDREAQYKVARMYRWGKGVARSYEEAFKWYTAAANSGKIEAYAALGSMYLNGVGVNQSDIVARALFDEGATYGCAKALLGLGIMYYEGRGGKCSSYKAFDFFETAAQKGLKEAYCWLGRYWLDFKHYIFKRKYYEEAIVYFNLAAEAGLPEAQLILGLVYLCDRKVIPSLANKFACSEPPKNYIKAFEWLERAAKNGFQYAQYKIGQMYFKGRGISQDFILGMEWLGTALSFDENAYLLLKKDIYLRADRSKLTFEQGLEWLKNSAHKSRSAFQYVLGSLYEQGLEAKGIEKNFHIAITWYQRAAKKDYRDAYIKVPMLYIKLGDNNSALQSICDSAYQENIEAQYVMKALYLSGQHVEQSDLKVVEWTLRLHATQLKYRTTTLLKSNNLAEELFRIKFIQEPEDVDLKAVDQRIKTNFSSVYDLIRRAEAGDAEAAFNIGQLFECNGMFEQGPKEAFKWYITSANRGYVPAQYQLALMYKDGQGIGQDQTSARKWFKEAALQGHSEAKTELSKLPIPSLKNILIHYCIKKAFSRNTSALYRHELLLKLPSGIIEEINDTIEVERYFNYFFNMLFPDEEFI